MRISNEFKLIIRTIQYLFLGQQIMYDVNKILFLFEMPALHQANIIENEDTTLTSLFPLIQRQICNSNILFTFGLHKKNPKKSVSIYETHVIVFIVSNAQYISMKLPSPLPCCSIFSKQYQYWENSQQSFSNLFLKLVNLYLAMWV